MNAQERLEKLLGNLRELNKGLASEASVVKLFQSLLGVLNETKSGLERKIKEGDSEATSLVKRETSKLIDRFSLELEELAQKTSKHSSKDDLDALARGVYQGIQDVKDLIPQIDFSEVNEKINKVEKKILPELRSEEIRNKLESLEGSDKLKIEDIYELQEKLEDLEKKFLKRGGVISGSVMGRDLVKDIDLSSQLDGVTKTFNIQAIWNVVSISLSSYPYGSLRKGVDYTWTPTSVTFGDSIDAETQLAVGQQAILTVVQA